MKKTLFEIGAKFDEGWSSDNLKSEISEEVEIKTPQSHRLYFAKEKRKGKVVTIVKPFSLSKEAFKALETTLKKKLSVGGAIKEDTLEFQGEVQERLKVHLLELEYRFK